ncbi:hypothetical protein COB11_03750 [Candidatus Aerophobetes bacterium]|uniref:Uncharacterized protein n=1 Tax=Aerophobetes bacterium TaxID=2030807 RepID=A0A2A4YI74_UNCAE|nr:MAG: hypothetical protein COB11_03750 [Candidatus Aerophobetes bacterium]
MHQKRPTSGFTPLLLTLAILVCCIGCSRTDSWRNSSIKTGNKEFDSSKLIYPASNYTHDFQLEFLYSENSLKGYINLYSNKAPIHADDSELAMLKFIVNGNRYETIVDRLSGGQRVRLPADALALLINLLEKHSEVTVFFKEGVKFNISTYSFKNHFKSLKAKPLLFIPNDPIGIAL